MKRIILLMLLPVISYGQAFEGGISGGVSTTSNPKGINTYLYGTSIRGGALSSCVSLHALFNVNSLMQTGLTVEYYGLNATYQSPTESYAYKLAKSHANVLAEINGKTGVSNYFYIGGALGIDNSAQFVWGAQCGYNYTIIKHLGIFAQVSTRKITTANVFTFPATIGIKAII